MKKLLLISILCFSSIQSMELPTSDLSQSKKDGEKRESREIHQKTIKRMIATDEITRERRLYDSTDMKKLNELADSLLKDNSFIQHDYSANEPQDPMVYFGMFYREIKEETAKDIQSKSKEPS